MSLFGAAFDLEGTSVDLEQYHHGAHIDAAARMGISIDMEFAVTQLPHFIGGPDEEVAKDIWDLSRTSITISRDNFVQEFLAHDKEIYNKLMQDAKIEPRQGLVEFVMWLRGMNVPFAIGSLTSKDQAKTILSHSGLDELFGKNIVLREDVERIKPSPDVFLKTASLMGVNPSHQIVFEDSPRGITAAIAATSHPIGMPVILHPSSIQALRSAGACRIFTNWEDPDLKIYVDRLKEELERTWVEHQALGYIRQVDPLE